LLSLNGESLIEEEEPVIKRLGYPVVKRGKNQQSAYFQEGKPHHEIP